MSYEIPLEIVEFIFNGANYVPPSGSTANFVFAAEDSGGGEPDPELGPLYTNFMILLAM